MGSTLPKEISASTSDSDASGILPSKGSNPKIIAIGDALSKRRKASSVSSLAQGHNANELLVTSKTYAESVPELVSDDNHPFVVAKWVLPHTPCIIRGIEPEARIKAIVYPGQKKRREFFYSQDRLIRVETESGKEDKTQVVYSYDPYSDHWSMVHDGITARMQGGIRLTKDGVLQIQIDESGTAREEHPDGTIKLVNECFVAGKKKLSVPEMEFLNVVSHDLRTPLMSVQGLLTLLSSGALGDLSDKARVRVAGVETEVARLIRLVNDLLEAGLVNNYRDDLKLEVVPVDELFSATIFALESMAARKKLEIDYAPSEISVSVNVDSFIRVLVNLVSNAVKYSPEGENVNLSARVEDDHVIISVQDYGKGISEENFERIFESFQRVQDDDSECGSGIGLGLAICKSIVEAHRGEIGLESRPGEGSIFFVRIPKQA